MTTTERVPDRRERWLELGLLALTAVPVVIMVIEVLRSPLLNFLDFWSMLGNATDDDGSLHPSGLVNLHNEHPFVWPGLLFWIDIRFLGGSNQALGMAVVLAAVLMVFALNRMLPEDLDRAKRAALTMAFAFLLLSPSGLELFGMSMNGVHGLSGYLPSVVALLFAHRGRTVLAVVAGAVGCLGYGSAFPVWFAVALVAWLRRDRLWQVVLPAGLGVGVGVSWLLVKRAEHLPTPDKPLGAESYLSTFAETLGSLWSSVRDVAVFGGVLTGLVVVVLVAGVLRERVADGSARRAAGWAGLGLYAVLVAGMVSLSRINLATQLGSTSRYAVIPALAISALLVLAVLAWKPSSGQTAFAATAVALVTFAMGTKQADTVRANYPDQNLLAIAVRVEAPKTMTELRLEPISALKPVRALGAYPYSESFTLGCGAGGPELGSKVDPARVRPMPEPGAGRPTQGHLETGPLKGDTAIRGWAVIDHRRPACVLVVDAQGTVVGGGITGLPRPDVAKTVGSRETRSGWRAVTGADVPGGSVLFGAGGQFYKITPAP
ncbi:hypothetical protein SAMN04489726_7605 [Allokutzneria albata]|uniref:4-amino-4-deoxy-L-arabinose transferase n=2 Tax=Allokutzneria albata TaxID=211114 RepID=A0A1H0D609_ALLAB|nr:hypothetical protein SAMN04489726_7605 [Allokutzneria albata]